MGEQGMPYDNIFVWNAHLTEAIRSRCNNTIWTIALVHGDFKQVTVPLGVAFSTWAANLGALMGVELTRLSIFGRDFSVSLVSRRSRHFAGTRVCSSACSKIVEEIL
ncbi:phosphoinositide phosphatase sac1 [Quercus suber]|uniref:Phosphoinositide phosphatase sac1 n=1 Tax=Quercus suber TaxID=58331 RepID=A0AAW0K9U5_QUESU